MATHLDLSHWYIQLSVRAGKKGVSQSGTYTAQKIWVNLSMFCLEHLHVV